MRGYLGVRDLIFSKYEVEQSIKTLTLVFSVFVMIVGAIALFITFFLLLISMT